MIYPSVYAELVQGQHPESCQVQACNRRLIAFPGSYPMDR